MRFSFFQSGFATGSMRSASQPAQARWHQQLPQSCTAGLHFWLQMPCTACKGELLVLDTPSSSRFCIGNDKSMLMSQAMLTVLTMCRCSEADTGDIIRAAAGSGKMQPDYITCPDPTRVAEAHRQGVLHMALLQHPQALAERYNLEGTETEGHKAARRNEHLLQLLLYLHVLAAEEPGRASGYGTDTSTDSAASSPHGGLSQLMCSPPGAAACQTHSCKTPVKRSRAYAVLLCVGMCVEDRYVADASELLSELSISLFGQPVTATDILTAEIRPHFGKFASVTSKLPKCLLTCIGAAEVSEYQSLFGHQALRREATLEILSEAAGVQDR